MDEIVVENDLQDNKFTRDDVRAGASHNNIVVPNKWPWHAEAEAGGGRANNTINENKIHTINYNLIPPFSQTRGGSYKLVVE